MRRFAAWFLVIMVLGGSAYIAWARTKQRAATKIALEIKTLQPFQPSQDPIEAIIEELTSEFFEHTAIKPSPKARKKIQELAERGQKSNEAAILLEQWLMQIQVSEEAFSDEFAEMARALQAVEIDSPRRVVKKHHFAQDDRERHFAELELIAFGKPALPAILEGIKDEAGNAAFVHSPDKSRLAVVLARQGADALPSAVNALQSRSPYVRYQGVRALKMMGEGLAAQALPDLVKVLDDPARSETHLAVVELLGDFGSCPTSAVPALRRLAGEHEASPLREAARLLLTKIDTEKD